MEISILGAGSWGTALAAALADNSNYKITLWVSSSQTYKTIILKRCNEPYLPRIRLPKNIRPTINLEEAVRGKKIVILALPSAPLRRTVKEIRPFLGPFTYVVNAAKGLEPETNLRLSQILTEELPENLHPNLAVISGPNHAEEVALLVPSVIFVASPHTASLPSGTTPEHKKPVTEAVQDMFAPTSIDAYFEPDLPGLEAGGALANVLALGSGICEGQNLGDNISSILFSLLFREAISLGKLLGANSLSLYGPAGLGNFYSACTSPHSRNKITGIKLGEGKRLSEIISEKGMTAEGINTLRSAYRLTGDKKLQSPVIKTIYQIIFEGESPFKIREILNL